jgi:hypothetical protein
MAQLVRHLATSLLEFSISNDLAKVSVDWYNSSQTDSPCRLIRLLKVAIKILSFKILFPNYFITWRCARHGVTTYMQLRLWLSYHGHDGSLLVVGFASRLNR